MKIGILTFHYAYNYGALFQAMSLFDYLKSLGHEVYIIDYRNEKILEEYRFFPSTKLSKNFKFYLTYFLKILMRIVRFQNFKRFIHENLSLMLPCNIHKLDCIIIGSDQVWNKKITGGYDSYYWGDSTFPGFKIAYAASMNATNLTETDKSIIKEKLKNFRAISVRESIMLPMLGPLTDKKINLVLDPTMLNDTTYWESKCLKYKKKQKFILAYPLRDVKKVISIASTIAKKYNYKMIVIKGTPGWNPFNNVANTAGPHEVLSLINNSEFVVTSSFHGTALSILLKKQFYTVFCNEGNNVRTENILNVLQLNKRLISKTCEINLDDKVDYSKVDCILNIEREKSRSFIINSLYEK